MDQVVNQAAKYRFMSGGEGRVPLVIRTQGGAGNSLAGQHSQSLEALFYHIPGLKVVMPATPHDAKGLLKSAIRDDDPVIFIEHKLLYMTDGEVPGRAVRGPARRRPTSSGRGTRRDPRHAGRTWCSRASRPPSELAADGISVEVIDLRTLVPMDIACVLESVRRTGHLVVAQEAIKRGGVGSDVAAIVAEQAFDSLQGADRAGRRDQHGRARSTCALEKATVPQVDDIVAGVRSVLAQGRVTAAR